MLYINNNVLTSFVRVFDGLTDCRNNHGDLVGSPRSTEVTGQNPWEALDLDPSLSLSIIAVLSLGPRSILCICFLMAQSVLRQSVRKLLSLQRPHSVTVSSGWFLCSSSCQMDHLFLWGPDCPSRWHRTCGWTEEELGPSRTAGAGAGGHGLWSERCFPQPPGCSPLWTSCWASCRSWLTGAMPFFPPWRPLGN